MPDEAKRKRRSPMVRDSYQLPLKTQISEHLIEMLKMTPAQFARLGGRLRRAR